MNSFGYRAESADLMRAFEARFQDQPNRLVEIGSSMFKSKAPFEASACWSWRFNSRPANHRAPTVWARPT